MVTLCWETHSSSYGSFLLIHKVLLTQNYCHERTGVKQQTFRASSQTPSLTLNSEASSSLEPICGLCSTVLHSEGLSASVYFPLPSNLWSVETFLFHLLPVLSTLLFSLLLTDIDKCLNCDQLIRFRQKISILRSIRAMDCIFQINQFYKHKSIIYILFPVFFLSF